MVQRVDQTNQGGSYLGSHVCHQLWLRLESTLKTSSLGYQSVDWDFSRKTYMKFFHIDCTHCGSQVPRFSVPKLTGQMEAISFYDLALEIMQHNFHYILSVRVSKISEGNQTPPFDRRQRFLQTYFKLAHILHLDFVPPGCRPCHFSKVTLAMKSMPHLSSILASTTWIVLKFVHPVEV